MKLNLVVLRTEKPKELLGLYEQLGLQFEYHRHGKGTWHYSVTIEGIVFEIYPLLKSQTTADSSLRLGFTIKGLDKKIAQLKQQDVEIVSEPKESEYGYFAVIKDLDGRKIELKEEKY